MPRWVALGHLRLKLKMQDKKIDLKAGEVSSMVERMSDKDHKRFIALPKEERLDILMELKRKGKLWKKK